MTISDTTNYDWVDTQWTLISILRDDNHPDYKIILQQITQQIYGPCYSYLRRRFPLDTATELCQSFFCNEVFGNELFKNAKPQLGKLRAYILTALKRHISRNGQPNSKGIKSRETILSDFSLDREEQLYNTLVNNNAHNQDDDLVYDQRWAMNLLDKAMTITRQYYISRNNEHWWQAYEMRMLHPALRGTAALSYTEVAETLHFTSSDSAKTAIFRVNSRMQKNIENVVATTTTNVDERAQELEHMWNSLRSINNPNRNT